jgi:hypothetical protein
VQVHIPPVVPYVIGAMLVLFGGLRVKYLGAPRVPHLTEDVDGTADEAPVRGKQQRRHVRMGVLWILMGAFLLVSTYIQIRRGQ